MSYLLSLVLRVYHYTLLIPISFLNLIRPVAPMCRFWKYIIISEINATVSFFIVPVFLLVCLGSWIGVRLFKRIDGTGKVSHGPTPPESSPRIFPAFGFDYQRKVPLTCSEIHPNGVNIEPVHKARSTLWRFLVAIPMESRTRVGWQCCNANKLTGRVLKIRRLWKLYWLTPRALSVSSKCRSHSSCYIIFWGGWLFLNASQTGWRMKEYKDTFRPSLRDY